jgi:hypothetical protein
MRDFANRPARERAEVFEETAAQRSIGRAAIVEKDFWVCWTLSVLFGPGGPADITMAGVPALLFKGGTSLSKVYGLIDRFSEDVDLTVARQILLTDDERPEADGISNHERRRRIRHVEQRCITYVRDTILPFLTSLSLGGVGLDVHVDGDDAQTIRFAFPRALSASSYGGTAYVNAAIRLEFGARGELWPAEDGTVTSYAAEAFPTLFAVPTVPVRALSPQRTFWEKATILHAIAMKGALGSAERQSRHYADLARMIESPIATAVLESQTLLTDVARHKALYFASPRARYDEARPGSLRLVPNETIITELERDYARMREMFIAEPPTFGAVLRTIGEFETRVNGSL